MMTSRTLTHVTILTLLSGLLFFWGLGAMGLTDRDEGRNAEAGREMLESGDWISPTFNYEPRYAKPALVYWLMSGSYHFFGVNERAARLPSAVFGLGLILMTYGFLVRVRDSTTALIGALMLLLNIQIISLSRMALTDSVVIFFTTLSLYGFWLGFEAPGRRPAWLWLFYGGMAFGTLAKGPIGFLIPLLTVGTYLTATKQWRLFWQEGKPVAGAAVFALLALPWYLAMWSLHGSDYAASAQANTVGRFLNPMEGHSFTVWFYIPVLLLGFFPWSGWLPFAWYSAFVGWRRAAQTPRPEPGAMPAVFDLRLEWFTAVWVLTTFVFFTLSSTRLPHYIGPLYPAAAILTAGYWSRCTTERGTRGATAAIHTVMLTGLLLAAAFAALPWVYETYVAGKLTKEFPLATQFFLGNGPYAAATVLFVGMALVGYFGLSEQRRGGAFWAAGGSLACIVLIVMQLILPGVNRVFIAPSQELAYAAGLNLAPDDQLIAYGSTRPSLAFYARRKVEFIPRKEIDRLRQALAEDTRRTMIILPENAQDSLPKEATALQPILKRYGYLLLANEPMVKIPDSAARPPEASRPFGH